jgi:hypothetical protein
MSQQSFTNRAFLGPRIIGVSFLTLMGAFGLNLTAGQFFPPLNQTYNWDLTTLSLAVSLNMITGACHLCKLFR